MPAPILHDAVTLRHFAAIGRLDVLERHKVRSEPRWTEAVRDEVEAARDAGVGHCQDILDAPWLGDHAAPETGDLAAIQAIHIGLNDGRRPPLEHYGEAESIYFAERYGGLFLTDDNGAYDFALRRPTLGLGRVLDSISVLQAAVADGELRAREAASVANAITGKGRHFRRCHPETFDASYFV